MTRTTEIRRATPDDAAQVAAIVQHLGEENVGLPDGLDAAAVRAWIERLGERGTILVAYDGSIPVAFGAIDLAEGEPDVGLLGVWVLRDYRRRGLATDIAEELLDHARDVGLKQLRGRLPEDNEPALSFLSAIGAMVPLRNPDTRFELPL